MAPTVLSAQRCKTIFTVAAVQGLASTAMSRNIQQEKKKNEAIKNTHTQARKHLIIDLGLKKGN